MNGRSRRSNRLVPGARFDYDRTRFCVPCKTGIACYRGSLEVTGEWNGNLVGIAANAADAQRFLEGALVHLKSA